MYGVASGKYVLIIIGHISSFFVQSLLFSKNFHCWCGCVLALNTTVCVIRFKSNRLIGMTKCCYTLYAGRERERVKERSNGLSDPIETGVATPYTHVWLVKCDEAAER